MKQALLIVLIVLFAVFFLFRMTTCCVRVSAIPEKQPVAQSEETPAPSIMPKPMPEVKTSKDTPKIIPPDELPSTR